MTKDRLEQLRAESLRFKQGRSMSQQADDEEITELTSLAGTTPKLLSAKGWNKKQNTLEKIHKQVNDIITLINGVDESVGELKKSHVSLQQSTRTDSRTRERIEELQRTIRSTLTTVRGNLQDFDKYKKSTTDSAILRVVKTQHSMLTNRYRQTLNEYQTALLKHKHITEDIIKRQLHIVIQIITRRVPIVPADKEVSEEELNAILDKEDMAVFVDNYMQDTNLARQSLQEARHRHQELITIEKEIVVIRDLFYDISMHVSNQMSDGEETQSNSHSCGSSEN